MNILEGNAIKEILESQDLPGDSVLMVHSAFHGLSQQGFRAEAVIEALLEKITNVTLLMPTMTWKSVTPEKPIFDAMNTPSQTGVLSEIFRAGYATSRSLHPTHSVAGYGQYTNMLLSTHHIGNTPTPLTSPYGIMQDYNSYILLLGVNIEVCTAIHFPEEIIAPQIYLNASEDDVKYTLIDQEEKRLIYSLRRHAPKAKNTKPFKKLLQFIDDPYISCGFIGQVPWTLLSGKFLNNAAIKQLKINPNFLIE